MKVYFAHSYERFDWKRFYSILTHSDLGKNHEWILPYAQGEKPIDSHTLLSAIDVMVAEVSQASTGMGIEIGWAHKDKKRIICVHERGSRPSRSLEFVADVIFEYDDFDYLMIQLENVMTSFDNE